jgi:flagellar FliJ protein
MHQRNAARRLGTVQEALDRHRERLRELIGYRDDYARRYAQALRVGLSSTSMRDYGLFLDRLDRAIVQQQGMVEAGARQREASERQWREHDTQARALSKVLERCRDQERREHERREQRELDDRSQRGRTADPD